MKLYLMQHAAAVPAGNIPARSLTEEGRADAKKIAGVLRRLDLGIAEIRHSTKLRSKQTAEIVAEALDGINLLKGVDGLLPEDPVAPLLQELDNISQTTLIVGHMPFVGKLASHLLCGDEEHDPVSFTNAGIVCLEKNTDRWQVEWMLTPRLAAT
jgi:phosphohistidine phosphatase